MKLEIPFFNRRKFLSEDINPNGVVQQKAPEFESITEGVQSNAAEAEGKNVIILQNTTAEKYVRGLKYSAKFSYLEGQMQRSKQEFDEDPQLLERRFRYQALVKCKAALEQEMNKATKMDTYETIILQVLELQRRRNLVRAEQSNLNDSDQLSAQEAALTEELGELRAFSSVLQELSKIDHQIDASFVDKKFVTVNSEDPSKTQPFSVVTWGRKSA